MIFLNMIISGPLLSLAAQLLKLMLLHKSNASSTLNVCGLCYHLKNEVKNRVMQYLIIVHAACVPYSSINIYTYNLLLYMQACSPSSFDKTNTLT